MPAYFAGDGADSQKVGAHISVRYRRSTTDDELRRLAAEFDAEPHQCRGAPLRGAQFDFRVVSPDVQQVEHDGAVLTVCLRVHAPQLERARRRLGMDADWRPHITVGIATRPRPRL